MLTKAVWGDDRETRKTGNPNARHFLSHNTNCPTVKVGTLILNFPTIYKVLTSILRVCVLARVFTVKETIVTRSNYTFACQSLELFIQFYSHMSIFKVL